MRALPSQGIHTRARRQNPRTTDLCHYSRQWANGNNCPGTTLRNGGCQKSGIEFPSAQHCQRSLGQASGRRGDRS